MRRLVSRIWLFAALLCLIGTLSAFAAASSHSVSEENSSELVELEKLQAIQERRSQRSNRRESSSFCRTFQCYGATKFDRILKRSMAHFPTMERDRLNGLGTYLVV
ncbi:MAG: hypothetical protein AB8B55_04110 [Mariniblastus sp.]